MAAAQWDAHYPGGGTGGSDPWGFVGLDYYSDDLGATWQRSTGTVDMWSSGVEVQEPDIVELKDGRLHDVRPQL